MADLAGLPSSRRRAGRIVAVAGGKGGVGKSCVAVNVGLALGQLGRRVVIVDADLGAANVHTMLGIHRPETGLGEFLEDASLELSDVSVHTGVRTVHLVPGTSRPGAANLSRDQLLRLLRAILRLDADDVIVDVGAGTSYANIDLVGIADIKAMVVTPQLTSIQNAYTFLKTLVHRTARRLPDDPDARAAIDRALATDGEGRTIPQLLGELRDYAPDLGRQIVNILNRMGVVLIGNMLSREGDPAILERISRMIYDHLLLAAPVIGAVRMTPAIPLALTERVPVVMTSAELAAAPFRKIATAIADIDVARLRGVKSSGSFERGRTLPIWIEREPIAV